MSHDIRFPTMWYFDKCTSYEPVESTRALTPLFGNGAGAHGIGKISGILTKIGKFEIILMYDVSIARLIPIIKLIFFLDI